MTHNLSDTHKAVSLNTSWALEKYEDYREIVGFTRGKGSWFTEGNPKLMKNEKNTLGSSYLPARSAWEVANLIGLEGNVLDKLRTHNACPRHTKECAMACLNTAGRGAMNQLQRARLARSMLLINIPEAAYILDVHYMREAKRKYGASRIARRANVISDYRWEDIYPPEYWEEFADVIHYDYTKMSDRAWDATDKHGDWPKNYHLTFSASERNSYKDIASRVASGMNVAVVVDVPVKHIKPITWGDLPAVDGDLSDERYLDPRGRVILLSAKGKARKATPVMNGFIKPLLVPVTLTINNGGN